MHKEISKYLSKIGRVGGRQSRRVLDRSTAQEMVKVREANRAFRRFYSLCFWSYSPDLRLALKDVPWVVEQLMKHGTREAWEVAARLCR